MKLVPSYVVQDDIPPEVVPDGYTSFYVTNLASTVLGNGAGKNEFQVSAHYVAETTAQKSPQSPSQAKYWHFIWQKRAKFLDK